MKFRHKYNGYTAEILGVISCSTEGATFAVVTDRGEFEKVHQNYLVPIVESSKPDMTITVGHVIDNPTFYFDGWFEITQTDDNGTVHTLYDSYADLPEHVPAELLIEPITYMVVNKEKGRLRIEIR